MASGEGASAAAHHENGKENAAGLRAPLLVPTEPASHGGSPRGSSPKPIGHESTRPLTLWPLVVLVFFEVSGGPFGTEVRRARALCLRHPGGRCSLALLVVALGQARE